MVTVTKADVMQDVVELCEEVSTGVASETEDIFAKVEVVSCSVTTVGALAGLTDMITEARFAVLRATAVVDKGESEFAVESASSFNEESAKAEEEAWGLAGKDPVTDKDEVELAAVKSMTDVPRDDAAGEE